MIRINMESAGYRAAAFILIAAALTVPNAIAHVRPSAAIRFRAAPVAAVTRSHLKLDGPWAVGLDPTAGTVYVSDTYHVLKLSASGKLLALWGRKGDAAGSFDNAHGLAVDTQGLVYVSDGRTGYTERIQKLSSAGHVLAVWHSASLSRCGPEGLAADSRGSVYALCHLRGYVERLSKAGQLLSIIRLRGAEADAISVDSHDTLLIAGHVGSKQSGIWRFSPAGKQLARVFLLVFPTTLTVDQRGNIYVTFSNHIARLTPQGQVLNSWQFGSFSTSILTGVAVDSRGQMFVVDDAGLRILKLSAQGKVLGVWS